MKQILVMHSPFLIFEDLSDAGKKQEQADRQGIDIFSLSKPPRTVTYEEAVQRVAAFVRPTELTPELRERLSELTRLRNQVEHYAVEVETEDVLRLLADLREPLLGLFERQLRVRPRQIQNIVQAWQGIQDTAKAYSEAEEEVFRVVKAFKGQTVPGRLLGARGEIALPSFDEVLLNPSFPARSGVIYRPDIVGKAGDDTWIVEVKGARSLPVDVLYQLIWYRHDVGGTLWLVAFGEMSKEFRKKAEEQGIFVTGTNEWEELKTLILAESGGD